MSFILMTALKDANEKNWIESYQSNRRINNSV